MTDPLNKIPPYPTPPNGPAEAAARPWTESDMQPLSPSVGAVPDFLAFKLTTEEREKIKEIMGNNGQDLFNGEYDPTLDAIEAIINEGWQTCD
jgi:hypothetical protein